MNDIEVLKGIIGQNKENNAILLKMNPRPSPVTKWSDREIQALQSAISALEAMKEAGKELPEATKHTEQEHHFDTYCTYGWNAYRLKAIPVVAKLKKENEELRNNQLTKKEFHNILSEFPPSITEDSGQPEWTVGEIDRVWDFITKKAKYIFVKDAETARLKELEGRKNVDKIMEVLGEFGHENYNSTIAQAIVDTLKGEKG